MSADVIIGEVLGSVTLVVASSLRFARFLLSRENDHELKAEKAAREQDRLDHQQELKEAADEVARVLQEDAEKREREKSPVIRALDSAVERRRAIEKMMDETRSRAAWDDSLGPVKLNTILDNAKDELAVVKKEELELLKLVSEKP